MYGSPYVTQLSVTFCTVDIARSFTEDCHAGIYGGGGGRGVAVV